jgi:hypothetical protein
MRQGWRSDRWGRAGAGLGLLALVIGIGLAAPALAAAGEHVEGGHSDSHAGHATGAVKQVNTYSLFMHRTSGVIVMVIGLLILANRLTAERYPHIRLAIGATWILMGIFIFVRSDRAGWPIGPNSFLESFTMPTRAEWIQHKLLALIPILLGLYCARDTPRELSPRWTYAAATVASLGALALTVHQHMDHPDQADIVNLQHRFFALTAFFVAASLILDGRQEIVWKWKPYLLPGGLVIIGLQLACYVE